MADDVPAARVLAVVRGPAGSCWRASRSSTSTGAPRWATAGVLALRLAFPAPDRTLTDEDVAPARTKIVTRLREELGGELRG